MQLTADCIHLLDNEIILLALVENLQHFSLGKLLVNKLAVLVRRLLVVALFCEGLDVLQVLVQLDKHLEVHLDGLVVGALKFRLHQRLDWLLVDFALNYLGFVGQFLDLRLHILESLFYGLVGSHNAIENGESLCGESFQLRAHLFL